MKKIKITRSLDEQAAKECVNDFVKNRVWDSSNISVTLWNHLSVGQHSHGFYEFALITQGSCVHSYRGVEVPLIPGDIFLIAPQEPHGYETKMPLEMINCQFYTDGLSEECGQVLEKVSERQEIAYGVDDLQSRWNELLLNITEYAQREGAGHEETQQNNLNKQGVIHLDGDDKKEVEYLLQRMLREQQNQEQDFEQIKKACLQMILVMFQRIQKNKISKMDNYQNDKKELIYQVIDYMENHLSEKIELSKLAQRCYWSEGHFRAVFKDVIGLSPVEYLNRLRIVKSLEYIEKDHLRIAEAAERVGIYDPSYYSRLFKKVIGYPPRYFKSIPNSRDSLPRQPESNQCLKSSNRTS